MATINTNHDEELKKLLGSFTVMKATGANPKESLLRKASSKEKNHPK